jgi:flavin reductase (DIM6/NTAB) family NADH-FMN oxidoreductase RutF
MNQGEVEMSRIVIKEFLQRCIEYADSSISRKQERGDDAAIIAEWIVYRDYTQHALKEIDRGVLNHWIDRKAIKADMEINMEELDHASRSKWLSAALSPRPLALVSTRDGERENLAPITSLSVVSNTPPLVVMSLSQNRDGKVRDTYLNLKANGECELQFLAATMDAAKDADLAGTPVEGSEWSLLESEGPIHPLAIVVMRCRLVEDNPLPEGAVARLLVLRVESMLVPSELPPEDGLSVLCQHGMDRLTPSPQDWGHIATHHRS